jgi:hypothetical protein
MDRMRSSLTVLPAVVACALLAGCGSGGDASSTQSSAPVTSNSGTTTIPAPSTPTTPSPVAPFRPKTPKALELPSDVPTSSTGTPADAVSSRVIRKWSGALSGGDIERAARFFSLGSKVQNGTPVVTLDTAEKRLVFNVTFPCGAKPTKLEAGDNGYTIVDFVLTERVDGDCGQGIGGSARCAIRVRRGHISDWYRIPEATPKGTPSPAPTEPSDDGTGGGQIA